MVAPSAFCVQPSGLLHFLLHFLHFLSSRHGTDDLRWQGLSKKTLVLFVLLIVAAHSINTTCFHLKEAYQQSSCCNSTTTQAATFGNLNLTCDDLRSSYTESSCCSAELSKVATMTMSIQPAETFEPSSAPSSQPSSPAQGTSAPTSEPTSVPSSEPSSMPSSEPSSVPSSEPPYVLGTPDTNSDCPTGATSVDNETECEAAAAACTGHQQIFRATNRAYTPYKLLYEGCGGSAEGVFQS